MHTCCIEICVSNRSCYSSTSLYITYSPPLYLFLPLLPPSDTLSGPSLCKIDDTLQNFKVIKALKKTVFAFEFTVCHTLVARCHTNAFRRSSQRAARAATNAFARARRRTPAPFLPSPASPPPPAACPKSPRTSRRPVCNPRTASI